MATNITINNWSPGNGDNDCFETLNTKLDNIMASIQQLAAEVSQLRTQATELQTTLDTEQEQIQQAIEGLNTQIQNLQQQITDGGTTEERQALLDGIVEVRNNLTALKTDVSGTIPDEGNGGENPPPDGGNGGQQP